MPKRVRRMLTEAEDKLVADFRTRSQGAANMLAQTPQVDPKYLAEREAFQKAREQVRNMQGPRLLVKEITERFFNDGSKERFESELNPMRLDHKF